MAIWNQLLLGALPGAGIDWGGRVLQGRVQTPRQFEVSQALRLPSAASLVQGGGREGWAGGALPLTENGLYSEYPVASSCEAEARPFSSPGPESRFCQKTAFCARGCLR